MGISSDMKGTDDDGGGEGCLWRLSIVVDGGR